MPRMFKDRPGDDPTLHSSSGKRGGTCYRRRHTARTITATTAETTTASSAHAAITPTPRASAQSNASKNRPIATER